MNKHLVVVGDVHGHYDCYLKIIQNAKYSFQLGDLGFDYTYLEESGRWNPQYHKFLPGNHDNYTIEEVMDAASSKQQVTNPYSKLLLANDKVFTYTKLPKNFVGHYGTWKVPEVQPGEYGDKVFFMRGAWSIDHYRRTLGIDLWENEELTYQECNQAIGMYETIKPALVITHTCPHFVAENYLNLKQRVIVTRTAWAMDVMFHTHKPKLWVFGHHHRDFDEVIDGCRFVCLNILSCMHFDEFLNPLEIKSVDALGEGDDLGLQSENGV